MNVANYLKRIGMTVKPQLNVDGLRVLQQLHLYKVPFENLDIHYKKDIVLDINAIEEKIVQQGRGGFCYELNALFYTLLQELGFDAKIVSARVRDDEGGFGAEFDHMTIIVRLDEDEWLVDVGFGDFIYAPLKIELDTIQKDKWQFYKIVEHNNTFHKVQESNDALFFADQFIFSTKARKLQEFRGMSYYHQTSPDSKFTQQKCCTIALPDGRITLTDSKFVQTKNGERNIKNIRSEKTFLRLLKEHFDIVL